MERSLVLIKPDAMERRLAGTIIARLERRGLRIVGLKLLRMDSGLAKRHYAVHQDKPFFKDLIKFITSRPIIAAVFEGETVIDAVRQTMGTTDPVKSAPGSIRGDFGLDIQQNLVHGSDSAESARNEIALFFNPGEILS